MNRQTLLVVFGGFFMAVVVAIIIQVSLSSKQEQEVAEIKKAVETTYILIADSNLDKGEILKAKDMRWQKWPKNALFEGAIERKGEQKADEALTGMIRRDVKSGEPLTKNVMIPEKADNFLAASLGEGMRAVSIEVEAATSVAGFVTPGDYVDVIMAYDLRMPSDPRIRESANQIISRKAVQTILQNVRVVAVDQDIEKKEKAKISRTVTLEVDLRQAEKVALAMNMGELSLTLRKHGDDTIQETSPQVSPPITDLRLSTVMQEVINSSYKAAEEKQKNNTGSNKRIMRIYNGQSSSDVTIN